MNSFIILAGNESLSYINLVIHFMYRMIDKTNAETFCREIRKNNKDFQFLSSELSN